MKLFRAGKTVSLDVISHGRISFSVQGNMPKTIVFDTKSSMLKRLIWYVANPSKSDFLINRILT